MTDPRVQRLLDAVLAVARDLDLERILERIVVAGCELVDARYGALGVIDEDGEALSAFVHHGVEEPVVRAIGHLPRGEGILGLLIDEPTPLRLDDLSEHPQSFGFPPNHPPMHGFLGAPIRVRDQAFGNLYLTEKRDGTSFTAEDEDLIVGLAAVAGSAIANARLLDEARRREAWRSAMLEISQMVLGGAAAGAVRSQVTALGAGLVEAPVATLVEPHSDGLWVLGAVGDAVDPGFLGLDASPALEALATGTPVRVAHGPLFDQPAMWIPIRVGTEVVAALGLGRSTAFSAAEEHLLVGFCAQVSFAWSFERAQAELQALQVLEDRERIGRDLHDTVIQRLFATGLSLQATIRRCDAIPEVAQRLDRAVDDIDETVKEIRSTIFALSSSRSGDQGLRSRLLAVVEEVGEGLARTPRVRFDGPIDTAVDAQLAEQLVPVVREALTNVVKHARADDVEVEVSVDQEGARLRISDDGVGLPGTASSGGLGLRNLTERAHALGGTLTLRPGRAGRGTSVQFVVPLTKGR